MQDVYTCGVVGGLYPSTFVIAYCGAGRMPSARVWASDGVQDKTAK